MIKNFEEFVSTVYGSTINEAYQSSKLRQIINQHGKPYNKRYLYDLKDSEIIDVVKDYHEYCENKKNGKYEDVRYLDAIKLSDGYYIVIGNFDDDKYYHNKSMDIIKDRHNNRHKGNLGKDGGDDIHDKHLTNVLVKKLKPFVPEIVKKIKYEIENNFNTEELHYDRYNSKYEPEYEFDANFGGDDYLINMKYEISYRNGEFSDTVDVTITLLSFYIINDYDTDGEVGNDDLGITKEKYKDLFEITLKNVEAEDLEIDYSYFEPYEY
jgi:hypothetical protein